MGSGKTTVADYLVKNYKYFKCSLGEKIHSECKLHGNETREEMQQYGEMMRKIFGINVWCDYLYKKYGSQNKIVIDDGRQIHEYLYFTRRNYFPIAVITDTNIRFERLKKRVNYNINPKTFNHETEQQARKCVDICNIKIYNNSSIDNLYKEIENKLGGLIN